MKTVSTSHPETANNNKRKRDRDGRLNAYVMKRPETARQVMKKVFFKSDVRDKPVSRNLASLQERCCDRFQNTVSEEMRVGSERAIRARRRMKQCAIEGHSSIPSGNIPRAVENWIAMKRADMELRLLARVLRAG